MESKSEADYNGTDFCVLCDDLFPLDRLRGGHAREKWSCCFRSVIPQPSSDLLSEPAYFNWCEGYVRVDQEGHGPRWFTIWRGRESESERAYCFHSYCWQLLKKNRHVTPADLIRLAQVSARLYSLPSRPQPDTLTCGLRSLLERPRSSLDDSLYVLLERVMALPQEILHMVLEHLGPCATRSLLTIESGHMQKILDQINKTAITQTETCQLEKIMNFHFQTVKGVRYLCGCDNGKQFMGSVGEIERVPLSREIDTVKFAIGPLGIRRLQFQAQDWKSKWAGDDARSSGPIWTAKISFQEPIRTIKLTWDGMKICAMDIPQSQHASFGDHFLWEGDVPLSMNVIIEPDAYYEHPLPAPDIPSFKIRGFPGWQLIQYLPFIEDECTLYGITVFCTRSGGMSGMGAHFRSNRSFRLKCRWIGFQIGSPIHFFLAPTEQVTSIWIRRNERLWFPGPFLMIKTNKGRTCNFGPVKHLAMSLPKLLAASSKNRQISGIYIDALRLQCGHITAFGLTFDPRQKSEVNDEFPPQLTLYRSPEMRGSQLGVFRSQAPLDNIRTIRACYIDNRCTGMAIEYINSSAIETVGRWFESLGGRHKVIYDDRNGKIFDKLQFEMSDAEYGRIVKEVCIIPTSHPVVLSNSILKVIHRGRMLVWWCSELSDVVLSRKINGTMPLVF